MLGPLCFGFVSLRMPTLENPWDLLSDGISKERGDSKKLLICDSKKLFQGKKKWELLEECCLSFYAVTHGKIPVSLDDFLSSSPLAPSQETLDRHPWYRDRLCHLPRWANKERIEEKAQELRTLFHSQKINLCAVASCAIPEAELNDSFRISFNKSNTHFEKCAPAIRWLVEKHLLDGGEIWIDRHGMRRRYAPALQGIFPSAQIWILHESKRESHYRLENESGSIKISFVEKGEDHSFAVALASIFAKYTRELLMERWNSFFSKLAPQVRPTAGYVSDARRYLREAKNEIEKAKIPAELLIRSR